MTDRALLRAAIKCAGSQSQLARDTGISRRAITNWTHGGNITPIYRAVLEQYVAGRIAAASAASPQ